MCYRSQKKTGLPYNVLLAFKADSGAVTESKCACPAGAGGACSHILAVLRLFIFLKKEGFKEAPPELSCTELPQQWGRPRRQGIKPTSVQDVDWRSSREGGVEMAMPMQLYDARAEKQEDEQQRQSFHALGRGLENIESFDFALVLLAARRQSVETKLGPAPAGSPMSYQQAQLPAGFTTWMSDSIFMGAGTVSLVPAPSLFDRASQPTFPGQLSAQELSILTVSVVDADDMPSRVSSAVVPRCPCCSVRW